MKKLLYTTSLLFLCITQGIAQVTLTIDLTTDATCNGNCDGDISLSATGPNAPFEFSIDGGSTFQASGTFSGLCAGTYNVVARDAQLVTDASVATINEPTIMTSFSSTVDVTCFGSCDGFVDATVTGGFAPYTYSWSSGQNTEDISGVCVGTYTLTVTDQNGCQVVDNVTINEPSNISATISGSDVTCFGSCDGLATISATGGTPPYVYTWDDPSTQTTSTANGLCVGTYNCTVTDANGCTNVETYTISEPTEITSTISGTDVLCNGDCDGTATITATGGFAPYVYTWDDPSTQTTTSATGLCVGTFTCTVTDANGCINTNVVTITEPIALNFSVAPGAASCNGVADGTIDFTASGGTPGYTYSIDEGGSFQGTSSYSGLPAGLYGIMVQDANGCMSSSSTTITEPSAITFSASATDPTTCLSNDGMLLIQGLMNDTSYNVTYTDLVGTQGPTNMLSDGVGSIVISNLAATTITDLTVELGGCSVIDSNVYNLVVPNNGLAINSSSAMADTASCANNDGNITGFTVSGGTAPYSYDYNGVSSTLDLINAQPGTYVLTVTDDNACTVSSSPYTIESTFSNITVTSSATDVACNGSCDGTIVSTANGGVGPYTYVWSNGMAGGSISGVCSGTYTLFVTDANGCEGSDVVTVNEPVAITNTITTTDPACGLNNGSAEVTNTNGGVSPYSYQWSNGSMTANADSISSGVYTVTVTDANGCISIEAVNVTSSTSPSISSNMTSPTCNGGNNGSIDLTVTGGTAPISFDWSTGENTEDISNLPAGIYDVTIEDASGCGIVQVFTLTDAMPIDLSAASITDASCGSADGVITVSATGGAGGYNYLWSTGGTSSVESGLQAGTYTLSVSDANGCLGMMNYTVSNASGPVISVDQVNQPTCQGGSGEIYVSVSGGVSPYTYSWSNGSTNEDLLNAPVGNYELIVTDANGCQGVEYAELLGINLNAAEICMVTVDTITGSNIVVWNKEQNLGISEYEIYKETSQLNVFQLLGTVPFDSLSQFIDTAANSSIHSYRYKLRTLDSCSNASEFLAYHKTIHLVSNIGLNSVVNLAWDDYIGFTYSTFYINRYHPTTGWEVIDSVASNVHSYTDSNYPSLSGLEYGIEVLPTSPCVAEKAQDHNTTRSNRASIAPPNANSIEEMILSQVNVYPNPSRGLFTVSVKSDNWSYGLYDMSGKLISSEPVFENSTDINIEILETGIYLMKIDLGESSIYKKVVKQ